MVYIKEIVICLFIGIAICFQGCIENDIPYPRIKAEIQKIDVEGMVSAKINSEMSTVTVKVADTLDLRNIQIKTLEVTSGATVIPDSLSCLDFVHFPDSGFSSVDSLPGTVNTRMNFKKPVPFLLRIYQDYLWTVSVEHDINRIIKVKNQVGTPLIDEHNKQVVIYVDEAMQSVCCIRVMMYRLIRCRFGRNGLILRELLKPDRFRLAIVLLKHRQKQRMESGKMSYLMKSR